MRPNPQETADLVTFTAEIPYGKLHFMCSAYQIVKVYLGPCHSSLMAKINWYIYDKDKSMMKYVYDVCDGIFVKKLNCFLSTFTKTPS